MRLSCENLYVLECATLTVTRSLVMERQAAGEVLYRGAVAAGAEVLFGKHVIDVDEATPAVKLEDGSIISADLIVGADGMYTRHTGCKRTPDESRGKFRHSAKHSTRSRRRYNHIRSNVS